MALSPAQQVEVAFYAGYSAAGVLPTAVATVIAALTPEGEARLTSRFLPTLRNMEDGIAASVDGMDTAQAAVWFRNQHELRERAVSYWWQRIALCRFLGLDPGPACSVNDLPPFSPCCPKGSVGGGTTSPTDPITILTTPAVFVV
jgi:hypothetical protein